MSLGKKIRVYLLAAVFLLSAVAVHAQDEKKPAARPAVVVLGKVSSGEVAPQVEYIGTVFFHELSEVAAEVDGKVVSVAVENGQEVKKGAMLVRLASDILDQEINNARALMEQAKADFDLAHLDDVRMTKLFKSKSVSEGEYDTARLSALASQKKYYAVRATLNQLLREREKKTILAPYDGVVLERLVHRGEWVNKGSAVVSMGRNDMFDVEVNVPAGSASIIKPGIKVDMQVSGHKLGGEVYAVVPRGDVSTRTFPVKIRVENPGYLAEGMEARVFLPSGFASKTLVVPRDAVISPRGQTVVWAAVDGKAVAIPVQVAGYRGLEAGVLSDDLKEGMDVVVKGNERLQPGQPLVATQGEKQ